MSLDAFSVIVAFLAAVETVLGAVAIGLGVREMRSAGRPVDEARRPLLVLVVVTLLVVALASIPLFWLLLSSWVPRWPGIMCVEGVRRIGTGSVGAPGWLPSLVAAIDYSKPALLFVAGAWVVLRRAQASGIARAAAITVTVLGALAVFDGAIETAYVVIPKEEVAPRSGCCMSTGLAESREAGLTPAGGSPAPAGVPRTVFVAVAALLGFGAVLLGRGSRAATVKPLLFALLAAASLPAAIAFLRDIAAPAVLGLPFHHCVWCAFATAPETIVGAALYLAAVLSAGWAVVARFSRAADAETARRLFAAAAFGFLGAAAMSVSILGWT